MGPAYGQDLRAHRRAGSRRVDRLEMAAGRRTDYPLRGGASEHGTDVMPRLHHLDLSHPLITPSALAARDAKV